MEQPNQIHRIIFLKRFTEELLINSHKKEEVKNNIEIEKLKQRFPQATTEDAFKKILRSPEPKTINKQTAQNKFQPSIIHTQIRKPLENQTPILPQIRPQQLIKKPLQQVVRERKEKIQIQPEQQEKPEGFNLGKLEPFAKDVSIQLIECPGPGKNILVKRYNQPNITKTILNQEEITNIINSFSKEARIPVTGGILKAAVGSLIISAVISEFVGSRFIINKISPYSMMTNQ